MTAIIIQQGRWNDHLAVNTQAYELALIIRQAQIYSLGVKEYAAGTGDKFNIGYGISVNEDNPGQYVYFADKNKNQRYDSGEEIETKTFTGRVAINRFCGLDSGGGERCSPNAGNVHTLCISFFRPEPEANILLLNSDGNPSSSVNPPATIYLRSPGGEEASIKVETNGQVSIAQ